MAESIIDQASHRLVSRKIKTVEELCAIIGPRPREKSVIMCHGTFDIVHPGHIRHLLYAKTKGDVLVASLTADEHIDKANFRPYVPQDLRAINLSALEMVAYVIVDREPSPSRNLAIIQPDYFAKGYELERRPQPENGRGDQGARVLRRRGDLSRRGHRLLVVGADRFGAAEDRD